ncbi:MAG: S9 family peptidase [Saprospiraceae bacterium]|nr:S9 family peptidase [Saprospiraceae bacterium]
MKKYLLLGLTLFYSFFCCAQDVMTPELLWQLGRLSALGISEDRREVIYRVSYPSIEENMSTTRYFSIPIDGGVATELSEISNRIRDKHISPDARYQVKVKEVKIDKVFGHDFYPELEKSNVHIYESLNYRHWDEWEDGFYSHLFVSDVKTGTEKDIMDGQAFDCPQKPFGGEEDYVWSPDSRALIYVTKRKSGTEYTLSTNTDILRYELASGETENLSAGMEGYDVNPAFSGQGTLAWLSMARDGYESDKNDIVIRSSNGNVKNLTRNWDGTVNGFIWGSTENAIYFNAPIDGTIQLFQVEVNTAKIRQITKGDFDVTGMVGQVESKMIVTRTDMNHASEIFSVDLESGAMEQLTFVNKVIYERINSCKVERRYVTTSDQKEMLTWVVYPPDFDPSKKYPTLLYCQGGPQSALSQFYSFRWNFQLMASQGYIIVAPNRRGMPGHGVAWNETISKEHGGLVMDDYLSAIDALSQENFVDNERLGCVGASYGGYSVFYLAAIHEGRFKSFISHDGIFNLRSMYGTTEELFFVNWDWGGSYWDKKNSAAMKSYREFDPSNMVNNWDTPILIYQGGRDYRVPIGQGLEAFQAAQLRGIKSRLIYLPEENHWVLTAQNAIVWQHEFFRWLEETL